MSCHLKSLLLGTVCAAGVALSFTSPALASTNEPAVNLGLTSFNDGFGGLTPGWAFRQYDFYEPLSGITGTDGKKIGAPVFNNQHIDAYVSLNQLIYTTPLHFAGATLGLTVLLPIVDVSSHSDSPAFVHLRANGLGLGDLTFGPYLQFPPIIMNGRPVFSNRVELDFNVPTGAYNTHKDINQGANFYSINPYYTFTVLPLPGFEISARTHYLYNSQNSDPAASPAGSPPGSSFTAGQAWWTNFDASYTVYPGIDLGINGYYFKQFTDDVVDGQTVKGTETTNLSIGPGGTYAINKTNLLWLNAYFHVIEKNTTYGDRFNISWLHIF